jgi:hypothetical protein
MKSEMAKAGKEMVTITQSIIKAGLAAVGIGVLTKVSRDSVKDTTESAETIGRIGRFLIEEAREARKAKALDDLDDDDDDDEE